MKSAVALRFAKILFFVFVLLHAAINGWAYLLWKNAGNPEVPEGSMHFAVGVLLALFAIFTFVLVYAQGMLRARDTTIEDEKLSYHRKAQVWRNVLGLIPTLVTLFGIYLTFHPGFFFISGVNFLIHLAYLPASRRMQRELRL